MVLSNSLRESLVRRFVVQPGQAQITALEEAMVEEIYLELREKFKDFPYAQVIDYVKTSKQVRIDCLGFYEEYALPHAFPVRKDTYSIFIVSPSPSVQTKILGIVKAREKLDEDKREFMSVLRSCTTTKQLKETVPAIEKYLPEDNTVARVTALVSMESVNRVRSIVGNFNA